MDRPTITRDTLLQEIGRALRSAMPDRAEELIRETEKRLHCNGESTQEDAHGNGHVTHTSANGLWSVWFKFGCAHISRMGEVGQVDYLHVCGTSEFIRFLSEAWEAPKNSVENGA